jgi:hypothetical protein
MRYRHYYVAPFIFVFFFVFCAVSAENVEWTPRWSVGDQFTVELVKERKDGKAAANKGRVLLDVSIQEKGKDFYILHCTYGKYEMEGIQRNNNPLVDKMMNLSEGLCLKIKTDEDGLPQELINIDEIIEQSGKSLDILEDFLKKNKLPQTMIDPMRAMYKKPEFVQSTLLGEIMPFFLFCGAKLELSNVVEFDDLLPNPFQGEGLPGKGTILLKEYDKQTGIAVVESRLTLDTDKALPTLFESMKKMLPQSAPGPTKEEMPQLDMSDRTLYRIDTKKGWALSVEAVRDIKANDIKTNEKAERVQRHSFKTVQQDNNPKQNKNLVLPSP